jgi:pimeloyl-ACP methyl ester carboxylesterase
VQCHCLWSLVSTSSRQAVIKLCSHISHTTVSRSQVMYDANMHKLLPKITCPALVVVGEKDFRWVGAVICQVMQPRVRFCTRTAAARDARCAAAGLQVHVKALGTFRPI